MQIFTTVYHPSYLRNSYAYTQVRTCKSRTRFDDAFSRTSSPFSFPSRFPSNRRATNTISSVLLTLFFPLSQNSRRTDELVFAVISINHETTKVRLSFVQRIKGEFADSALAIVALAYNRGRFRCRAMLHFPSSRLPLLTSFFSFFFFFQPPR